MQVCIKVKQVHFFGLHITESGRLIARHFLIKKEKEYFLISEQNSKRGGMKVFSSEKKRLW